MTLLSRLATKPHLIAQTEGVTIVEALKPVRVKSYWEVKARQNRDARGIA